MLELIKAFFSAIGGIFEFFKNQRLIKAGEDAVVVKQKEEEVLILDKANEARVEAKAAAAAVPPTDSLPDDGFRRD